MLVHTHRSAVFVVLLFASHFCLAFGRPINNEQHPHRHGRKGIYDGLSEESQVEGTVSSTIVYIIMQLENFSRPSHSCALVCHFIDI